MSTTQINLDLLDIEKENNVRICRAADYGSRSWNLDSSSSDYDVGFIFYQPDISYKSPGLYEENISRDKGEHIEYTGWNIKRFAELLVDSNPMAIEFLNSSEVYRDNYPSVFSSTREHANQNFKPIALFYHYRSMAEQNYKKYISEEQAEGSLDQTVKRHLYVLRGLLYARYVEATHDFPNLNFMDFVDEAKNVFNSHDYMEDVGDGKARELANMTQVARHLAEKKKDGDGGEDMGNPHQEFIESELDDKLDAEGHTENGIDGRVVARMVHAVTSEGAEGTFREFNSF